MDSNQAPRPLVTGRGGRASRGFRALLKAARIKGARGTHSLRHSFAMRVYRTTRDLLLTKEALGHRSVASTMVYARADESRLRRAVAG